MKNTVFKCPCDSLNNYQDCCNKFHKEIAYPITAEELMRSRYSAFVLADGEYLLKTHSKQTKNQVNKSELVKWAKSVKWLGLRIINKEQGQKGDEIGFVEFEALFKEKIFKRSIHEKSKFIKQDGKWVYLNGIHF